MRDLRQLSFGLLLAFSAIIAPGALAQVSNFNPVGDDTDLFLANPAISAERPNVLIILDNTANWNQPFDNEKAALVTVVNTVLTPNFNVGLEMFNEAGIPNAGGTIRFGIRQMTSTNQTALAAMANGLDKLADKGDHADVMLTMEEAYDYFKGIAGFAGTAKPKRDYNGNTVNAPLVGSLPGNALSSSAATVYTSPFSSGCQKNFIIFISNGPVDSGENTTAQSEITTINGGVTPPVIPLTPNGEQSSWADEFARLLANTNFSSLATVQNIVTYTVDVNPGTTGKGPDHTALLQSMALNGKGKYFAVDLTSSDQGLINALTSIFQQVQAVNSVFASTTLPVSVNVRGTNLNQVYIGVFRPDPQDNPRWFGNLKMYQLGLNSATNSLFLADSTGAAADDPTTGFVVNNATSFWTSPSSFWSYRGPPFASGDVGGASDSPDGNLVEKGGAAERLRINNAASQSARTLYSCTSGLVSGVNKNCISGSDVALSSTPFDTTNSAITAAALGLTPIQSVVNLSAFAATPVSSIVDSVDVTAMTNSSTSVGVTSITNGTNTKTITGLTDTGSSIGVTSLTAASYSTLSLSGCAKVTGSIVCTTTTNHGFANGATVVISGTTADTTFNSAWQISSVTATTFQIAGPGGSHNSTNSGSVTGPTGTTTTATATTSTTHGLSAGNLVTISGSPTAAFNGSFTVLAAPTTSTFTYTLASAQGEACTANTPTTCTASGVTEKPQILTVTATTSAAHGYVVGQEVAISGVSPSGYNGNFTISAVPTSTTFQFILPSLLPVATSGGTATSGTTTNVTVNLSGLNPFNVGDAVTISGAAPSEYNGTKTVTSVGASSITFTSPNIFAPQTNPAAGITVTANAATGPIVSVTTAKAHGFVAGTTVVSFSGITSPTSLNAPATWTVLTTPTTTSFTFSTGTAVASPAIGTSPAPQVRVNGQTTATATTSSAHGYSAGNSITIKSAAPSQYDGTFTISLPNTAACPSATCFTYTMASAPGANATGTITANKPTTTATANVPAHGFSVGQSVTVAGATPSAFNAAVTVASVPTASTFTYTLGSAQGDATGTITVSSGSVSAGAVATLVGWVRGADNLEDENLNGDTAGPTFDVRASIHGDVLHSRPAVINYNRDSTSTSENDDDVFIFYGANDGIFHAVKGGFNPRPGIPTPAPGDESWGFIPQEYFSSVKRIRDNTPQISPTNKKPYFMDGPIGVYTNDADNNGHLGDPGDSVNLYIGSRRGGRFLYALDVNNPMAPNFLWEISNTQVCKSTGCTTTNDFAELGFTWSVPNVAKIAASTNPVLIFGAGYDPAVDDNQPCLITVNTATSVTATVGGTVTYNTSGGCSVSGGTTTVFNRSMGRGIFVVNAITGAVIWQAGPVSPAPVVSGVYVTVPGMTCAIASDTADVSNVLNDGLIHTVYVGDECGNLWRVDVSSSNPSNWVVTELASISGTALSDKRKFQFAPDVVFTADSTSNFSAILIGSGDREHPFDATITNRFYMFKDRGPSATIGSGSPSTGIIRDSDPNDSTSAPGSNTSGFKLTLVNSGEKTISNAVTSGGVTFFNTNQPSATAGGGTCGSNLGIAREYDIGFTDASPKNYATSSGLPALSVVAAGGGYLPSPVPVIVTIGGKQYGGIISGTSVQTPPSISLQTRVRTFWYEEIE